MPSFAVGRWTAAAVLGCAVLAGHLDGSGWTTSPELDQAVSPSEWVVHVYLRPDQPVAYLSAMGQ